MDVISISDSTDGSVGIRSLLFHYSAERPPKLNEDAPLTEEPISLSSASTERCPVTWRTKQKINLMKNLISEKTPCATAKVESWLTQNNTKSNFSTLQLEALDGSTVLRLEPLKQGGSILIRHDYNKDLISYTNAKPCYLGRKIFSAKKGVQNVDEGEVIYLDSDSSNKSASEDCGDINERVDCSNPNPSDDKSDEKKKSKQKSSGVPLSPESQKKNELCSYLQLMDMNCTDKKIGSIIQNRRSVRVQNLNMLSERKKLEKELRGEAIVSEGEAQENDKDLAKKSFAELKINVTKENDETDEAPLKMRGSKNGEVKSNFLCVSALPRKFLECSVDFDETMKMFINAEKIPITKSTPQCNNVNGAKLKLSKLKDNSGTLSGNNRGNSFRNNSGNLSRKMTLRNLRKYKNLKKSNRKLRLVKKTTEKKKNNLLRKQNSSSAIKRHKLSFSSVKAGKKFKRRSAAVTKKVTNVPDANAVQVPINEGVKIIGQNLNAEQPVSQQKRRESILNSPKKKPDEHKKPKENKAVSKSVKAFMEKNFCVIDLSHQNEYTNSDTLLDHNYASKPQQIDKNYIMNVIVGQPFISNADEKQQQVVGVARKPEEEKEDVRIAPADVANKLADVSSEQQTPSNNLIKIKASQQTPAVQEEKAEAVKKKKKLSVTPIKFNYTDFSDELNMTVKNKIFDDKMSLTINDKPPVNIFEDSAYLQSPVSLSDTCMKEILDNLGDDLNNEEVSPIIGGRNRTHYIPFNSSLEAKPLHKSLMRSKRKLWPRSADATDSTWDNKIKRRSDDDKRSYSIQISKRHGTIVNAFYLDFNLIIAQEQVISFWSQSALGNMLSAQNMWISKGSVQRLVTDGNCIFKKSPQAVISLENSVAYVELWIKEHKSDKRERPVADIFATIYFCRHHLNGPDKKVLQLENINGIASDVQYVVLRNSRNIIVSWCETCDDTRKTYIHCYNLASDYQTVVSIRQMGNVDHYIASLHNIEDCDTLVMGCGEHKVTLWNVEYGYVVATIAIDDIRSEPSTLWVKCDRGFLFMLQFYELENMFKLIAINGIHHSWKRLKMFTFPSGYKGLRGVCLDNNIMGAFYNNGIVCWNIQTGESVIEEMCSENVYVPSEKHIIIQSQNGILVRHALSHFITSYDL